MKDEKKYRIIGAAIAIALHVGIGVAMFFLYLSATSVPEPPLPTAKSEITFGGEFVQLGDIPLPNLEDGEAGAESTGEEDATDGSDNTDEGETGDGESLVSADNESEATSPKRNNGPTEAEKKEQERVRKEKERQQQERNSINNRTSNAFNRNNGGNSGAANGNAESGSLQGNPGHNLGANYRLEVRRPSCKKSGTIRISVTVLPDGTITEARYKEGSGAAAADMTVRRQFVNFTKTLRFKVSGNATEAKKGVITWEIRN